MEFPEFFKAFKEELKKKLSPEMYRKALRSDLEADARDYFNSPDAFDGPIDSADNFAENVEDLGFVAISEEAHGKGNQGHS